MLFICALNPGKVILRHLIWIADSVQFVLENCLNRCQISGWFSFLTESEPIFGFLHTLVNMDATVSLQWNLDNL